MGWSPRPRPSCGQVLGFRPTEFAPVHTGADGLMRPLNFPLCPLGGRRNSADWTWPLPLPFSLWLSFDTKKTARQALAGCRSVTVPGWSRPPVSWPGRTVLTSPHTHCALKPTLPAGGDQQALLPTLTPPATDLCVLHSAGWFPRNLRASPSAWNSASVSANCLGARGPSCIAVVLFGSQNHARREGSPPLPFMDE